jgi:predicted N-acetyltransferase YhbS
MARRREDAMALLIPATGRILDEILDQSWPLWGDGLSRPAYAQWNAAQLRTAWGHDHLARLALVDDGRLLCSAKRYRFTLWLDGRRVRALGIGAVFTPPGERGRGHAPRMIEALCDEARADGCELAMLFSEIGAPYYERLGFRVVPVAASDVAVITKDGAPAVLVRAGEERDAAHVAQAHAWRVERYRLGVVPDGDQVIYSVARKRMLAGLDPTGRRTVEYFVTEEGHQAVAFVLIQATRPDRPGDPETWSLAACGDRDPEGARIGAMLQVLLARHPGERPPIIRAWWPHALRPPQLNVTRRGPAAEVMMIRPLLGGLRIEPWFEEREVCYWHGDAF